MINERKLTENELEKREVALKGLLKNKQSLVKKYGKDAEKVMYGIATKQAKSKVEAMNLDKIKETIEGLDIGSRVKIAKEYGGGKGTVEDIKGSFVVVKTKKGNKSYHESDLKPIDERIKELVVNSLTKEDNDPSGEYLEGDPDEKVEENIGDINDPVLMKMRATDDKPKINPDFKALKNASKIKMLKNKKAEIMRDMEQEAEPEGGKVADKYGRMLNKIDSAISKLGGDSMSEDLDIGHEDDEPSMLKAELARAGQMIQMLYRTVDKYDGQGEVDFPQWWQKKIIQANAMLDSAFDYIDGKEKVAQIDAMIDVMNEEKDSKNEIEAEKAIRQTLKDEGGAAGLEPLVKAVKKFGFNKEEVVKLLKKVVKVDKHEHGDYILTPISEKISSIDEVTTDKEFEASEEEARLDKHPEKDLINKIKAMMSQEKIKEILTKKSSVDKHIEDFKDSDAPQFKGKSDKKKVQMAVASFLAKQDKK